MKTAKHAVIGALQERLSHPKITAVISFCSNDFRFLKPCVEGVAPFCEQILITFCDHFFDGSEENYALLEDAFRRFPQCTFLGFQFDLQETYHTFSSLFPEHPNWRHEWHNTGRMLSWFYSNTEYLFFLDCDEIVNQEQFSLWLQHADLQNYSAHRFAMFWHFREARFVALAQNDLSLLVKKEFLKPDFLWDEDERMGLLLRLPGEKKTGVLGANGQPMIHHYTGVRTKEEFLKKCATWGHHWERNWEALIENAYSQEFSGTDFIRHYHYREEEPLFDPLLETVPEYPRISLDEYRKNLANFLNVVTVDRREIFRRQLEYEFFC